MFGTINRRLILLILALTIVFFTAWFFKHLVAYILISVVLSIIGHPIVKFLGRLKVKGYTLPKGIRAAITLITLWGLLIGFLSLVIPLVVSEVNHLSKIEVVEISSQIETQLNEVYTYFESFTADPKAEESFNAYFEKKINSFISLARVSNIVHVLTETFGDIIIAILAISFITFFFLKEERLFYNAVMALVPDDYYAKVKNVLRSIQRLLTRYFIGLLLEMLSVMILVTTGLIIVGIEFNQAVVIGFFAGCFNIIPYIGPMISTIFGLVLGTAIHIEQGMQLELLPFLAQIGLVFLITYTFNNFVTQPFIYSNSVHAHPLEIFLVILAAASIAGVPGMVFAIPTYTIIRIVAKEFFSSFKLVQKLTKNL